jgi:glycosyltransferase involved in cell wall biosynthesis
MVIETLRALLRLDYPCVQIVLIDDNTDDESLWRPVESWCLRHGVTFKHLENWPGYKSGALNYALQHLTHPDAEIIGVVDSDYQVEPQWLRDCVPLFADPWIGFVQAPQDYRHWHHARYYRRLYYSYKYFFAVSQPSRNERDGAIFAGTMGLIRRVALDELGGWDEWCITEDAEVSLRLLRAGWSGMHVDESGGRGIMPLTFEALKGQRYRWCFGGIQLLRMHWKSLLPGQETTKNHLSAGQRWSYLSGALQWYGDLLGLLFFLFLLAGAVNLATGGGQLFRKLTVFLVAAVPVLILLGLVRAIALLRRSTGATWRDAIGAFFIWQSTSLVVACASVLALFASAPGPASSARSSPARDDIHAGTLGHLDSDTNDNPERHPNPVSDSDRHDDTDSLSDIGDPDHHALHDRLAHSHLSGHASVLVSPGHLSPLRYRAAKPHLAHRAAVAAVSRAERWPPAQRQRPAVRTRE